MHDWKEKVRDATATLFHAVGDVLCTSRPHDSTKSAVRIVQAVTDMLHAQELVNEAHEAARKADVAWRESTEQRLRLLEEALARKGAVDSDCEISPSRPRGKRPFSRQGPVVQDSEVQDGPLKPLPFKRARQRSKEMMAESMHTTNYVSKQGDIEAPGQVRQETPEIQEVPVEQSPKPIQSRKNTLQPLPTYEDARRHNEEQARAERARKRYKPPPCDKCKLRKRAVMMRDHGRVNEAVFERWANKPGACIEYMHQDEELSDDQPRSRITFDETETQSPRPG